MKIAHTSSSLGHTESAFLGHRMFYVIAVSCCEYRHQFLWLFFLTSDAFNAAALCLSKLQPPSHPHPTPFPALHSHFART